MSFYSVDVDCGWHDQVLDLQAARAKLLLLVEQEISQATSTSLLLVDDTSHLRCAMLIRHSHQCQAASLAAFCQVLRVFGHPDLSCHVSTELLLR